MVVFLLSRSFAFVFVVSNPEVALRKKSAMWNFGTWGSGAWEWREGNFRWAQEINGPDWGPETKRSPKPHPKRAPGVRFLARLGASSAPAGPGKNLTSRSVTRPLAL